MNPRYLLRAIAPFRSRSDRPLVNLIWTRKDAWSLISVSINKLHLNNFFAIALPATCQEWISNNYKFRFLSFRLFMSVNNVKINKFTICVTKLWVTKPGNGPKLRKNNWNRIKNLFLSFSLLFFKSCFKTIIIINIILLL